MVTAIKGMAASETGSHAILRASVEDGTNLTLAIPSDMLPSLMRLTSVVSTEALRLRSGDPAKRTSLPVERWEVLKTKDDQTIWIAFQLVGGFEMTFRLPTADANQFCDALASSLGRLSISR